MSNHFNFDSYEIKKIKKGTIIQYPGDLCKYGFKVVKGCLKSYIIDYSDKVQIIQFAPEDWILGDTNSLIYNKPTSFFIETIEDSEIIYLPFYEMKDFNKLDKEDLINMNIKLFKNIISLNNRLISLLSLKAEDRYKQFIEIYPNLFNRLPLKLIASYLGMKPEYLSDLRKKLAKN